jgi:hypothetical protein
MSFADSTCQEGGGYKDHGMEPTFFPGAFASP